MNPAESEYIPRGAEHVHSKICMSVYSSIIQITKKVKQYKYLSPREYVVLYTCTMECYSVIKIWPIYITHMCYNMDEP